jgi:hypothetical protein
MVNQDQDLSRRMDIQQCLQYDAGVSLSILTLCSDYRMSHFPDASGPTEYIADYRSEAMACERTESYDMSLLSRKVYGRRKRTTGWPRKGSHRMFQVESKHTTGAESLPSQKALCRL